MDNMKCLSVGSAMMGFDVYNMASTGGVFKTLNSIRSDSDHTPVVCYGISAYTRGGKDDMRTTFGVGEQNDPQFTISAAHCHAVCYSVENHPNDSRMRIRDDGTVQTLSARCGTGGGNTPCALICCDAVRRIQGK